MLLLPQGSWLLASGFKRTLTMSRVRFLFHPALLIWIELVAKSLERPYGNV
jgi:hypothetical protein